MAGAKHTEVFNCKPQDLYKVITDYASYPQFLNEVKECKVVATEGNTKTVEFKVSLIKTFTYKLKMVEEPDKSLRWTFAGGDLFKTSTGSWVLEDLGGKTKATYEVDATFSMFVPGTITKTLLAVNLPNMMAAYHKRLGA